MAVVHGTESEYILSLEKKYVIRVSIIVGMLFAYGVLLIYVHDYLTQLDLIENLIIFALASIILYIFDRCAQKNVINYCKARNGYRGENEVFKILSTLTSEYTVFRGVKIFDTYDIDFVVTGPTGIFTIEVKSHRGTVGFDTEQLLINSKRFVEKDVLWQAMQEALSVHNFLYKTTDEKFFVEPILVFSNPKTRVHFGFERIKGVYVIGGAYLVNLITKKRNVVYKLEAANQLLRARTNSM